MFRFVGEPTSCFGDDPSILVPGGKILAGDLIGPQTYLYSIADNTFAPTGTKVYNDSSDEEGWAVIPSGQILTYDLFQSIATNTGFAEEVHPCNRPLDQYQPGGWNRQGDAARPERYAGRL